MKKILIIFMLMLPAVMYGQRITNLTSTNSAASTNLIITAETGEDTLKSITKANFLSDYVAVSDTADMLSGYILGSEVSDIYAPIASPTFTGTVTIPSPFTLGSTSVTASGSELNVLDDMTATTEQLNYLNAATGTTGTTTSNLVFSVSPTFTGTVTTATINIGSDDDLDSLVVDDSDQIWFFQGSHTLGLGITSSTQTDFSSIAQMLTDYQYYEFGSGVGLAGDTALIDASLNGYGNLYSDEDSIEIVKFITNIPAGDSVNYSVVYNDSLWVTADCDTIVSINADEYETVTSSGFSEDTIPEGNYIWVEMDNVVATRKPVKFRVKLVYYIKRD